MLQKLELLIHRYSSNMTYFGVNFNKGVDMHIHIPGSYAGTTYVSR